MAFRMGTVDGRAVLIDGDRVHDLEQLSGGELGPDPRAAVAAHRALHELAARAEADEPVAALADVVLGTPVPWPRHVFGVGLNYRTHAAETGAELPTAPSVFTKFPGCLSGPAADVVLASDTTDYEAELVVVLGDQVRDVPVDDAWSVVAGVMAGQDVSDRGLQFAGSRPQFSLGKSHDGYGPTGPYVVSPDLLDDRDDLRVTCTVDGELRQDDTTANLVFPVAELVAYLSSVLTLYPGDLIFTGTPAGVGAPSGTFLRPGQTITTTIAGVGTLTNRCVAGSGSE
jgi:2-keto-4-pentenoate hydratase/2-oxohepta-3-ene-1,7-dioic acid hydratase in catechol pathway